MEQRDYLLYIYLACVALADYIRNWLHAGAELPVRHPSSHDSWRFFVDRYGQPAGGGSRSSAKSTSVISDKPCSPHPTSSRHSVRQPADTGAESVPKDAFQLLFAEYSDALFSGRYLPHGHLHTMFPEDALKNSSIRGKWYMLRIVTIVQSSDIAAAAHCHNTGEFSSSSPAQMTLQ
ncbi:hypothetical protein INT43_007500 [Umbelopsis isabellina]|uniref:Uncharacterized protein n=1 Tax=Mortierella isabellina TaxID=91625 RepID=A0A8H7Q030_MORIS|nr:hypothetical protein INT43_007500 [Umbelopsis isabellina]